MMMWQKNGVAAMNSHPKIRFRPACGKKFFRFHRASIQSIGSHVKIKAIRSMMTINATLTTGRN